MKVLRINARDTLHIRQSILSPHKALSECRFEGDDDDQTFHLGAFKDGKLVCIASFYFERHPDLDDAYQYRLRGMATLPEFQRTGLSSSLLQTAFPIITQNFCHLVWCNAREDALKFYEFIGFESRGEFFDIKGIGPHKLLTKHLH